MALNPDGTCCEKEQWNTSFQLRVKITKLQQLCQAENLMLFIFAVTAHRIRSYPI
jgi:hypothetical protein